MALINTSFWNINVTKLDRHEKLKNAIIRKKATRIRTNFAHQPTDNPIKLHGEFLLHFTRFSGG